MLRNAFENLATHVDQLSQEEVMHGILLTLVALLENSPRTDAQNRMMVNNGEVTSTINIAASQTLATVSTVTNTQNIGNKDASNIAFANANAGTIHIYNNIVIS